MVYVDGLFYDKRGQGIAITGMEGAHTTFSNGEYVHSSLVKKAIESSQNCLNQRAKNKKELKRRREENPILEFA